MMAGSGSQRNRHTPMIGVSVFLRLVKPVTRRQAALQGAEAAAGLSVTDS
jgi:hypothetical protein